MWPHQVASVNILEYPNPGDGNIEFPWDIRSKRIKFTNKKNLVWLFCATDKNNGGFPQDTLEQYQLKK